MSQSPSNKVAMKTIVVVFALCLVGTLGALTEQQREKLKAYRDSCIAETGVDPRVVASAKNGTIPENKEKLGCFAACMLKKIGIMNPDGTFNAEVTRAKVPEGIPHEKAEEIINKCKDITGANTCEKGGNLMKCFKEIPILQ